MVFYNGFTEAMAVHLMDAASQYERVKGKVRGAINRSSCLQSRYKHVPALIT